MIRLAWVIQCSGSQCEEKLFSDPLSERLPAQGGAVARKLRCGTLGLQLGSVVAASTLSRGREEERELLPKTVAAENLLPHQCQVRRRALVAEGIHLLCAKTDVTATDLTKLKDGQARAAETSKSSDDFSSSQTLMHP